MNKRLIKFTFSLFSIFLCGSFFVLGTPVDVEATSYVSIYTTGFETAEGFVSSTTYNNPAEILKGPAGQQWAIKEGTVSTTSPISGLISLQTRDYATVTGVPYARTNFEIDAVAKVTFKGRSTSGYDTSVSYSTDSGANWLGAQTFELTTTSADCTYLLPSPTDNVMLKFTSIAASPTVDKAQMLIDDVVIYQEDATVYAAVTNVNLLNSSLGSYIGGTYSVGDSETITASVLPTGAAPAGANQEVTWSSSDNTIVRIVGGVITAVGAGTATIYATSVGLNSSGDPVIASAPITVNSFGISNLRSSGVQVSAYLGKTVSVTGTVTKIEPNQKNLWLQSGSEAIVAYQYSSLPVEVIVGSLAKVTGVVTNFNGLLELAGIPTITAVAGSPETISAYSIIEGTFNSTSLLGMDSRLVTASLKYVSGTVPASSTVSLAFQIGSTSAVVRVNYYAIATAIGTEVNAFLAKAGTSSTIIFTGALGWTTTGPQFNLISASELTSVAVTQANQLETYLMEASTEGQCTTKYATAKTTFLAMGAEAQYAFQNNSGYSSALARYQAWAIASGDATPFVDGASPIFNPATIQNQGTDLVFVIIVGIIGMTGILVYGMNKDKKHSQE